MTKWYKKIQRGSETFFMFQDYWTLIQNYWNWEDTDDYWESFATSVCKFTNKYTSEFAKTLAYAFLDEQERKRKVHAKKNNV